MRFFTSPVYGYVVLLQDYFCTGAYLTSAIYDTSTSRRYKAKDPQSLIETNQLTELTNAQVTNILAKEYYELLGYINKNQDDT